MTSSPTAYVPVLEPKGIEIVAKIGKDLHLALATDVVSSNDATLLKDLATSIQPAGFIILDENKDVNASQIKNADLILVAKQVAGNRHYILLKKREDQTTPKVIPIVENDFSWLEQFKTLLKSPRAKGETIVFVSQNEKTQGKLIGNHFSINHFSFKEASF